MNAVCRVEPGPDEVAMRVIVKVSSTDATRAWDLLVRHSSGTALPDRTFIISEAAARARRKEGIRFKEVARLEVSVAGIAAVCHRV
jgi:hypothetical protein